MSSLRRRFRKPSQDPVDHLTERSGVAFGDSVRVLVTPVTEAAGVAGRTGTVHGQTTPSLGYAADVVGRSVQDVAVSVAFEDGTSVWVTPDLVEFIDHQPGLTIGIGGATFARAANGAWEEAPPKPGPGRR